MKKTKNYAMPYPEQDDYFNVEDFQDMMVSVDDLMKKLSDSGAQISSDAEHLYNQTKAQMDNIQKRMNAFTALRDGSTTGDAELKDIRVAYDGKEYGNAGEAVREQASDIHKALFGAGASIWSKVKAESTKYVAETKGICILNECFTAAGVVTKISRGTFAENESTLNLDRECSAYIVEFEKNPGTVYMPSAETIKIVSTTKIIFEANGNARCWIPVEKGQYLAVDSTATAYTSESNHVPYMLYDQANKTLEFRGFGSAGSIEPVDPYSLALEYKLEYDMDDTGLVKQIDANREDVASLKEDLANQENRLEPIVKSNEDSKDAFYICDADGNIICKVDEDGVHSTGFDGKNLALNDVISTYEDSFYISDSDGNVIFMADKDGARGLNMGTSSGVDSPFKGMKLLTIGDSLSAHNNWQKWLVEWLGVTFDNDENINGKDGHKPMAKGGTAIAPTSEDSIYMRALDAKYYVDDTNGTVIIVYAGQNDSVALGTIDDTPYTDKTVTSPSNLTFYSSYMGMIENILADIPFARIYLMTQMPVRLEIGMTGTADPYIGVIRFPDMTSVLAYEASRYKKVEAIRAISKKYSLPCIDLWADSGINDYNSKYWYGAVGGTCGQVHPNNIGYKRMAEVAVAKMY